jgi:hypothetical protein
MEEKKIREEEAMLQNMQGGGADQVMQDDD